jgi:hypothetical protein
MQCAQKEHHLGAGLGGKFANAVVWGAGATLGAGKLGKDCFNEICADAGQMLRMLLSMLSRIRLFRM